MNIKTIANRSQWNEFVTSNDATFLHAYEWGIFNETLGYKSTYFGLYDQNTLIAVFLVLIIASRRGSFLFVPHGPVLKKSSEHKKSKILKMTTDHLKTMGGELNCSFIRISPLFENSQDNLHLFSGLGYRNAPMHMHSELCWILDIRESEDNLLKNMRKTTRYLIRQQEKFDLSVWSSNTIDDFNRFYDIYKKTEERQGFVGFGKTYLKEEFLAFVKSSHAKFYFANQGQDVVACAFIITFGDTGYYHHGATLVDQQVPAAYALQWNIIKDLKKNGLLYYNFWGVSPRDKTSHPWHGLSQFKRGFGGFEYEFMHAQDFIINPLYMINWIVESIRRTKRGY